MSSRVSVAFRQHLLARANDQNLLVLLHVSWTSPVTGQIEHLRLALAAHDVVSGGELYRARAFELKLPDEGVDEEIPVAQIAIDGVPPDLRVAMRTLADPAIAELRFASLDDPDTIEWSVSGPIRVANFALPTMTIEIHLYENLAQDPSVGWRFNPASGFRSLRL